MKTLYSIIIFLFLTIPVANCQKLQYGGMQQLGLIFGEKQATTSFNLINGVRFSKFFTGIGLDAQFNHRLFNYVFNPYNTSAVYADGRYYINKKKNFFAIVDGGVNFINEKMSSSSRDNYKKTTGYYTAFGLGFKAKIGKEIYYSFDVNYSVKQTRFNYNYINFRDEWQTEKYEFIQSSILVKMGIEIF